AQPPAQWCDDLIACAATQWILPQLHLIVGTRADDGGGAANLDAMHAQRLASLPGVCVTEIPEAGHMVVKWLAQHDRLDALLLACLTSPRTPAPIQVLQHGDPALTYAITNESAPAQEWGHVGGMPHDAASPATESRPLAACAAS